MQNNIQINQVKLPKCIISTALAELFETAVDALQLGGEQEDASRGEVIGDGYLREGAVFIGAFVGGDGGEIDDFGRKTGEEFGVGVEGMGGYFDGCAEDELDVGVGEFGGSDCWRTR